MEKDLASVNCEADKKCDEEHLDAHTVFVRNLPFNLTDSQLEEVFNEIGPVRRCFTIKEKGSEKHRGFGFVQFTMAEDATRAVELKSGVSVQGRKVSVELAKRRVALSARLSKRQKENIGSTKDDCMNAENNGSKDESNSKLERHLKQRISGIPLFDRLIDTQKGEQAFSRIVVLGGLISQAMRDEAISRAKKIGSVESVQLSLSAEDLNVRGLARDGCKMDAAAIFYSSVSAARLAVAALHRESIGSGTLWARQVGGEGSKPLKWRVIVRNLPFQVTEQELYDLFSATGFVWEINVPRDKNNLSKGFAFAAFTSKADAERAIKDVNMKTGRNRPVAVDWAVAKKFYEKSISASANMDSSTIAGEKNSVEANGEDESYEGEDDNALMKKQASSAAVEQEHALSEVATIVNKISNEYSAGEPNVIEEMNLARKVLNKVAASVANVDETGGPAVTKGTSKYVLQDPLLSQKDGDVYHLDRTSGPGNTGEFDVRNMNIMTNRVQKVYLKRTVFIQNLPLEADAHDVKEYFMKFGSVESLHLVHHPVTKRPKGSAFLKFVKDGVAEAVISRSNSDEEAPIFAGRKLSIHMAIDKRVAHRNEKEKNDIIDKRNLYLAKEGQILDGMAAAASVSESDMQKRKLLEKEKNTKLKSPNFHVSRTRLIVHNIPRTMKGADMKKMFINAIKSRATKQHPVVKQVKILQDEMKSGVSRGVGFIEFTKHEHALVALRVLNNNPETFGPEHRPIVEFAVENVQTLKMRVLREINRHNDKVKRSHTAGCKLGMENPIKIPRKSQPAEMRRDLSTDKVVQSADKETKLHNIKEKRINKLKSSKSTNADYRCSRRGEHEMNTKLATTRKRKRNVVFQEEKNPNVDGPGELPREAKRKQRTSDINGSLQHIETRKRIANGMDQRNKLTKASDKEGKFLQKKVTTNKRKLQNRVGREPGDRLDKIISEYHSKYFSNSPQESKSGIPPGKLRILENIQRWYD